jgi:hypothetical protein
MRTTLVLKARHRKGLSAEDLKKLSYVRKRVDYWRKKFYIPEYFRIRVTFEGTKDTLMHVKLNKEDNCIFTFVVTRRQLAARDFAKVDTTIIHELIHLVLRPYSRLVETCLKGGPADEAAVLEEHAVTQLENIISGLVLKQQITD